MKPKTMVLMVLAIVCGLAASYMTSQLIAQKNETVAVLVAKERITQWSTIREPQEMFVVNPELPKKEMPPNAIVPDLGTNSRGEPKWIDNLRGRRLKASVEKGGTLTDDAMLKKEVTGLDLPLGKRALSVPINNTSGVSGFIVPGTRVDVVHTLNGESRVLLPNILVLAIDMNVVRPEDRIGIPGTTATLQLDNTEQVLKLTGARDKGQLSLVMRPAGDEGTDQEDKVAAVPPPPPPPPPLPEDEPKAAAPSGPVKPPPPARPKERSIDILDGGRGTRVTYVYDKENAVIDIKQKTFDDVRAEARAVAEAKEAKKEKPKPQETPAPAEEDK